MDAQDEATSPLGSGHGGSEREEYVEDAGVSDSAGWWSSPSSLWVLWVVDVAVVVSSGDGTYLTTVAIAADHETAKNRSVNYYLLARSLHTGVVLSSTL